MSAFLLKQSTNSQKRYNYPNLSEKYSHAHARKKRLYTTMWIGNQEIGRHKKPFTTIYMSRLNRMTSITMITHSLHLLILEIWGIIAISNILRHRVVTSSVLFIAKSFITSRMWDMLYWRFDSTCTLYSIWQKLFLMHVLLKHMFKISYSYYKNIIMFTLYL